jgi:hypothetical protein
MVSRTYFHSALWSILQRAVAAFVLRAKCLCIIVGRDTSGVTGFPQTRYPQLGTQLQPLFSSASADFKTFVLDPEVGYRVVANEEKARFVDVLGGVRYWHLRADLNFDEGILSARSATGSRHWVDGVAGLRGRAALSRKIFVSGKADLGGGGSKLTYQLFGGVGIRVGERTSLIAGYRHLHVNYDRDNFLFDMSLAGPIFGVSFGLGK